MSYVRMTVTVLAMAVVFTLPRPAFANPRAFVAGSGGFTFQESVPSQNFAARAGVGFYGKNTMMITRRFGSWVVLGTLVTELEIEATPPLTTDCGSCTLCIEACPTRSLTMSNDFELASDDRRQLIYTKEQLLAPLLPGMERPPHPMRLGDDEKDYYVGALTNPGTSVGAERSDPATAGGGTAEEGSGS